MAAMAFGDFEQFTILRNSLCDPIPTNVDQESEEFLMKIAIFVFVGGQSCSPRSSKICSSRLTLDLEQETRNLEIWNTVIEIDSLLFSVSLARSDLNLYQTIFNVL